jgi:hypothetical protein
VPVHDIVSVNPGDPVVAGCLHGCIAVAADTAEAVLQEADAPVAPGILLNDCLGAIGGAVVANQQFKIRESLCKHALYCLGDESS